MAATGVTILTFLAGFLAIFAVNLVVTDLFQQDRRQLRKRLEEEVQRRERMDLRERARSSQDEHFSDLAEEAFEANRQSKSLYAVLKEMVEQSGLQWTVQRLLTMCGMTGTGFGALGYLGMSHPAVAGLAAAIGAALPVLYVRHHQQKRMDTLRSQLPDAFDLMSRVMRAGQTITQAMYAVSQEFKAPVAIEFGYCYEQQNLGLSPEVALRDLARRTGLLEIKIFVLALLVHRQVGGNLTELLEKLAEVVRERFKLRGKIRSMTAEGRFQGIVLLALPPFLFGAIAVMNPDYAFKLLEHPRLIVGTLVSMGIGALWIRQIVNFDF